LADKFGQKNSIVLGYMLDGLAMILMFVFPTTLMLYPAFGIRGLAGALISGAEEALPTISIKYEIFYLLTQCGCVGRVRHVATAK
jgi:hypothetical protein